MSEPSSASPRPKRNPPAQNRFPAEVRRKQIIEATRSVIAEKGFAGITMRDMAQAAGISLGTLSYHFTAVNDLLAEILRVETDEVYAEVTTTARQQSTGLGELTFLVDQFLASNPRMREHWLLWLNFWAISLVKPEYANWQRSVYRQWHRQVETAIKRGVADGSVSSDDPYDDAVAFAAMLDGLVVQTYMPGSRVTPKRARALLTRHVNSMAAGKC
jgi:AcrR family transcriptional regulator